MPSNCCIPSCKNSFDAGYKSKRFPSDDNLKKIWIDKIRNGIDDPHWSPTESARLCEVFFCLDSEF